MFGPMREVLKGRRFSSDEEVSDAVQNWLETQPKKVFFLTELKLKLKLALPGGLLPSGLPTKTL
jgi:hypothetical protein